MKLFNVDDTDLDEFVMAAVVFSPAYIYQYDDGTMWAIVSSSPIDDDDLESVFINLISEYEENEDDDYDDF